MLVWEKVHPGRINVYWRRQKWTSTTITSFEKKWRIKRKSKATERKNYGILAFHVPRNVPRGLEKRWNSVEWWEHINNGAIPVIRYSDGISIGFKPIWRLWIGKFGSWWQDTLLSTHGVTQKDVKLPWNSGGRAELWTRPFFKSLHNSLAMQQLAACVELIWSESWQLQG